MKVKALQKILYAGEIYKAGTVLDMDNCTAAISAKYNKVKILEEAAAADDDDEMEIVAGLPPLKK